jgi:phthalate 4,5-dioxygenase
MLKEETELLTRTGPGTPCGELMRRYWQPAALSEELPVGGAPLPLRLLGEDLVLFRDPSPGPSGGQPGLLGLHCSHRGADLSYGRLEDGGLRCIYHGWLYDRQGRCLEQPGEPGGSTFHERIRHRAYPCIERNGAIFAYLGPGDPPEFPNYEFLTAPPESAYVSKCFHECSYLQANEGSIDLVHLSFLHYMRYGDSNGRPPEPISHQGAAPFQEKAEIDLTPYGVRTGVLRPAGDPAHKRLSAIEFVLPNFTAFSANVERDPTGPLGYGVNWHVPIDDTHHWKYQFIFRRGGSIDLEHARDRSEMVDYQPVRNLGNRFLQDRTEMEFETYTGLGKDFAVHDKWATESQGPIQDHTAEHLGAVDVAVMMTRKLLLKAIHDLESGREPANVIRDPARNSLPITTCSVIVPASTDWKQFCRDRQEASRV